MSNELKEKAIIESFFNKMVAECSGTDNGVDAVLDDYIVDNALRPFMEYYVSKLKESKQ